MYQTLDSPVHCLFSIHINNLKSNKQLYLSGFSHILKLKTSLRSASQKMKLNKTFIVKICLPILQNYIRLTKNEYFFLYFSQSYKANWHLFRNVIGILGMN